MTATTNDRFVSIAASAGQTALAYDFRLTRSDAIVVNRIRAGVTTALTFGGGDFSFPSGLGTASGGSLTLASAALAGDVFQLVGTLPEDRTSDFSGSQAFDTAKINAQLDALTLIGQEHRRDIDRAWKSGYGTAGGEIEAGDEGELSKFDADGNLVPGPNVETIEGYATSAAADAAQTALDRIATAADRVQTGLDVIAAQAAADAAQAAVADLEVDDMTALLALTGVIAGRRVNLKQHSATYPGLGAGTFLALDGNGFHGLPTIAAGGTGSGYTDGNHVCSLNGGGGTGGLVYAVVENGKVVKLQLITPGSGYTSAPALDWTDIPGGGTPGTVTFSTLDDGGVYVRTTAGALLVREEFIRDGTVRPEWWGAVGEASGTVIDDAIPINKALAFIRWRGEFSGAIFPALTFRCDARYNILTTIDATKFRARLLKFRSNGALLHVRVAAGVGIDFTNTRNLSWPDAVVYCDATNVPKYGVVFAIQHEESSPWNDMSNAELYGFATDALLYNMGSEFMDLSKASIANGQSGGHAIILDPINTEGFDSDFAPRTTSADTWYPMSEIRMQNTRWSSTSADGIRVTGQMPRLKFEHCYAAPFNASCVAIYQPSGIVTVPAHSAMLFDIRGEPRASVSATPVKSMVKFYTTGGDIAMHDMVVRDYGMDYQLGVIEVAGAGTVSIRDGEIHVGSMTNGGASARVAYNPSGTLNFDGRLFINGNSANLGVLSGFSTLYGDLFSRVAEGSFTWPAAYAVRAHFAGTSPKFMAAANSLTLPSIMQLGTALVREYTGVPHGNITANAGSIVMRTTGQATTYPGYVKRGGGLNTSGWEGILSVGEQTTGSLSAGTPRTILAASAENTVWMVFALHSVDPSSGTSHGAAAFVLGDGTTPVIFGQQQSAGATLAFAVSGTNIQVTLSSGTFSGVRTVAIRIPSITV